MPDGTTVPATNEYDVRSRLDSCEVPTLTPRVRCSMVRAITRESWRSAAVVRPETVLSSPRAANTGASGPEKIIMRPLAVTDLTYFLPVYHESTTENDGFGASSSHVTQHTRTVSTHPCALGRLGLMFTHAPMPSIMHQCWRHTVCTSWLGEWLTLTLLVHESRFRSVLVPMRIPTVISNVPVQQILPYRLSQRRQKRPGSQAAARHSLGGDG